MFTAHNSVRLQYNNKVIIKENAVLDFRGNLDPDNAYGAFIIADQAAEPACLVSCNTDILRGELYAEYEAVFDKSEYDGMQFSSFSLSKDGINKINEAEFEPVIKLTGEEIRVSVTIYLKNDSTASYFVGGDNPLVQFLLGMSTLRGGAGVVSGHCNMKTRPISVEVDATKIRPASLEFDEGSITFSATSPVDEPEIVFCLGDKPVLRVYAYEDSLKLQMGQGVVRDDFTFELNSMDVEYVVSTVQNNISVMGGHLYHSFDRLYKTQGLVEFELPLQTTVKSDMFERFIAAATKKEVFFFDSDNGVPRMKYRVPLQGYSDFSVCENGYLVLFGDNIRIYSDSDSFIEYELAKSEFNAVFNEGAYFFYLGYDSTTRALNTYKLRSDGSFTHVVSAVLAQDCQPFVGFFGVYLLSLKQTGAFVDSAMLMFSSPAQLVDICNGASKVLACDGLVYAHRDGGHKVVTQDGTMYTLEGDACVKSVGKYLAVQEGFETSLLCFDRAKRVMRKVKIEGINSIDDIKSVSSIGEYMFITDSSDRLYTYYRNKCGAFVWYGGLAKGQNVTYSIAARGQEGFDASSIKTTLTLQAAN